MTEIPHLTTALSGPLLEIENALLTQQVAIEAWFREQWEKTPPPLMSSVDLRNAGFKLGVVDTNLFPAGFNNLNPAFIPLAIQAAQASLSHYYSGCKRILLIPESHTRHAHYYENLYVLKTIIQKAGYDVRVGSLIDALKAPKEIPLSEGKSITLEPVMRQNDRLVLEDFDPCLLVLNNDLSDGIPDILHNLSQSIVPSMSMGWHQRLKSQHFQHATEVNQSFAEKFNLDAWLINPDFRVCNEVDFVNREGEACLMKNIDDVLGHIQKKYDEHHVEQAPFVVVKADSGTYGMGILMVRSSEEIKTLNRKQRAKLSTLKGAQTLSKVIIQEGIYSYETIGDDNAVAEPVIYMMGNHVIGGFYRVHTARGSDENLNAPGMHFEPLSFAEPCNNPDANANESANRFYAYGVLARLSALAAAREIADHI